MTSVVAELNQLLVEAEQVSSDRQRQREMEAPADDQPIAMDTESAEPATTTVRRHVMMLCCQLCFVQGRECVRSPPHSDTSSSGSRGGENVSLVSLGVTIGDRVVIGAGTSRQPKVRFELAFANGLLTVSIFSPCYHIWHNMVFVFQFILLATVTSNVLLL